MTPPMLEHVNVTVTDPERTARTLCELLGWHIRWQGTAIHGGMTVHVGSQTSYLALYAPPSGLAAPEGADTYRTTGGLNHIGIVVDDLDAVEARVKAAGFTPRNHADYEPGRRFYVNGDDGVEFEFVSYA